MHIDVDKKSDIPLYLQIVQNIISLISCGELKADDKLPTVRELSNSTGISMGTIKHAYDELEKTNAIVMQQGKGTFVLGKEQKQEITSKKQRAMIAIETLLDELDSLGFTPREVEIFFELKLRERQETFENVQIASIDCNPEALSVITKQLADLPDVHLVEYLLDDVISSPFKLMEPYDIILTTNTHYGLISELLPSQNSLITKVVMSSSQQTIIKLSAIPQDADVGIWCQSRTFAAIAKKDMRGFENINGRIEHFLVTDEGDFSKFLSDKKVLVVSPDYLSFTDNSKLEIINDFETSGGIVIFYDYMIDKGSLMFLKERIKEVWMKKRGIK